MFVFLFGEFFIVLKFGFNSVVFTVKEFLYNKIE